MRYIKSYTQLNESTGSDILKPHLDKFSNKVDSKKLAELILPNKDILLPYYNKYVKNSYRIVNKNDIIEYFPLPIIYKHIHQPIF